jgi:glucose-6-phosphate 1-dehydrogenase
VTWNEKYRAYLQADPSSHSIPNGTILVIFGASGDLTRRKLMPALYHLSREDLLPECFHVIGLGRRIQIGDGFEQHMKLRVGQYCSHGIDEKYWAPLAKALESFRTDHKEGETYQKISDRIAEIESQWGMQANRLFYLATSPSHFSLIVSNLAKYGLNQKPESAWTRLIVEKPFGLDLRSADVLNSEISQDFREEQIYRIDHFLGKEAVQNILVFRLSNLLFQPLWNREYFDHIQITCAETVGIEGREDFFEQTGAIRDMVQSHLLQILALVTMEPPRSLDPEEIRDEKVILLRAIRRYDPDSVAEHTVRGQYLEGVVNSEFVPKYINERGVPEDSKVESYAAVKLYIDNFRWRGVPFYLRTGKRMPNRKTEIFIQLKQIPDTVIPTILSNQRPIPNTIRMEIQPRTGIDIMIGWKPAGLLTDVEPTSLEIGGKAEIREPKAYERLLVDAMRGDSTLFIRFDEIREMWKIVDPIIKHWESQNKLTDPGSIPSDLHLYAAGMQGPKTAESFIQADNNEWTRI